MIRLSMEPHIQRYLARIGRRGLLLAVVIAFAAFTGVHLWVYHTSYPSNANATKSEPHNAGEGQAANDTALPWFSMDVQNASVRAVQQVPVADTLWEVQVASFRDATLADGLLTQLEALAYNAYITPVTPSSDTTLQSVRVGTYTSQRAALRVARYIEQQVKLLPVVLRAQGEPK